MAPQDRTAAGRLSAATRRLRAAGVPNAAVDARALLLHALGWRPAQLTLHGARTLTASELAAVDDLVDRRARRVPLQRIVGRTGFRRLEVDVVGGVFVPRPETEVLVDLALDAAPAGGLVVEPCTGSGVIAAALADERPGLRIVATDADPCAVALARRTTAPWAGRVTVLEGDLLAPVDPGLCGHVDVLVSNPPYVAAAEWGTLEPEVTAGDPVGALVAGPTGHEVTDRLVTAALRWLHPGGALALEVDSGRAAEVARRCTRAGLDDARVQPDLTGAARFVTARRPTGGPQPLAGRARTDA